MSEERYVNPVHVYAALNDAIKKLGLRGFCRKHNLDHGNVSAVMNFKKPMQKSIASAVGYCEVKAYKKKL